MPWIPTFLAQRSECSVNLIFGLVLNLHSIVTDPSTSTQQKKRSLFEKASGTKEAVKQSADERIPEDIRDESSGSETKDKTMLGRIRGMRVIPASPSCLAGTHSYCFVGPRFRQDSPGA